LFYSWICQMTGLKWSNKLADKKRTISDIDAKEEFFIFLNCERTVTKTLFMFLRLRIIQKQNYFEA